MSELPLPPATMRYMGESDESYLAVGDDAVADLREVVGLRDDERILDIGCGYGRLAHALMRDDSFAGGYLGVDIVAKSIEWCRRELVPRSGGRAEFRRIDVANAHYNPRGSTPGHEAQLGIEPGSFDVVALISVFTHFDPETVQRYLGEIARALAPGGRAFISAFLLNSSWRDLERSGASPYPLPYRLTPFCRCREKEDPLAAIGYQPKWLMDRAREAGLRRARRPRLGTWCGREDGVGFQDVLALRREP